MRKTSDNKGVIRAAGTVGFATLISRLLGFIRDMLIAKFVGTGMAADAFFVAFRIPNLLRRLMAEGAMSSSLIPVFTEYLNIKGKDEAWKLAHIATSLLAIILFIITIAGIILTPAIVKVIAPGFTDNSAKFGLTVTLTRIMFPFIFFIGMAAAVTGMLNSLKSFFISALSPAFFNIAIISSALFLTKKISPTIALSLGVLIGGFFQFAFQLPELLKKGFKFVWQIDLQHSGMRRIGLLLLPSLIGIAPHQINILVDNILASFLKEGSVSYLYYGNRLVQFPLGIFAIAIATAILPVMSEQIAKSDIERMKETFAFAIKFVLLITIPASVGFIILRIPIINVLFEYGKFTKMSTFGAAQALLYYSVGLWAYAGVKIAVSAFYSMQDAKTPVKIACYTMLINIFLSILFMVKLEHGGLAFATSISSAVNVTLLVIILRKRIGSFGGREVLFSIIKTAIASFVMGWVIYILSNRIFIDSAARLYRLSVLLVIILSGILVYIGISIVLKNKEMAYILKMRAGQK